MGLDELVDHDFAGQMVREDNAESLSGTENWRVTAQDRSNWQRLLAMRSFMCCSAIR